MATSSAAVGVVLKAPVMPMHAILCNLVSSFAHTFFLFLAFTLGQRKKLLVLT